jgi:hypothetical protein
LLAGLLSANGWARKDDRLDLGGVIQEVRCFEASSFRTTMLILLHVTKAWRYD